MLEASGEMPEAEAAPAEPQTPAESATKHPPLTLLYERKGRGGKQATIIAGFEISDAELQDLAALIKKRLATGGSARGGEILIQGDRRADLRTLLPALGYKVK
ncbi:MAG: translation initiation factor [Muribaculaceae bacterium]|nr:translation initiation factor [Muribaculaceae bacterium]